MFTKNFLNTYRQNSPNCQFEQDLYRYFRMTKVQKNGNVLNFLHYKKAKKKTNKQKKSMVQFYFVIHLLGAIEHINHDAKCTTQVFSRLCFPRTGWAFWWKIVQMIIISLKLFSFYTIPQYEYYLNFKHLPAGPPPKKYYFNNTLFFHIFFK